ncbi:MAG: tRNA (adenosine(37)-N6)-threonylcarbamoyltransferase complex ATPase subunit type 1 TsaE [Candidatus Niyogibacteria bacterium CG10_big_fil_rev_8_21_14_0_10_42_19]|uniref:tRNA threonylcarbamoyladenosine biosynthesis protein TsaE n=1 Tax=Candidatus Niyogibacteria bacterium CG10_big_fil_rev_8_21_14_0_10_42_19 TaxID=1974725 RepID=A0A2H0TIS1_9BACT|nr:MAG: tRNA (adenosine(37)-N6)-threonylcarbamoyltransferase complex ATPase subunit type 1 TsaE [Candidatus Niyogibacteria bacterium CG10_big_fil_rev_8_21_14_0_10_42_19]
MELFKLSSQNHRETRKIARILSKEILRSGPWDGAVIVGLVGDLGSGKTVFAQGFAEGLGIKNSVKSPTFVLVKNFKILRSKFKTFSHIDAYRLKNAGESRPLGWSDWVRDSKKIILVEWADRIKKIMPSPRIEIKFEIKPKEKRMLNFFVIKGNGKTNIKNKKRKK